MRRFLLLSSTHLALLLLLSIAPNAQRTPSLASAQSLLRRGSYSRAAEAFEKITVADPRNGQAWFGLGSARHGLKEWQAAAAANARAAEFAEVRATALYNLACAQSLGGSLGEARASLARSIEAGFLDFDLMERDSDLEPMKKEEPLQLPPKGSYLELKARNGIRMLYAVHEPANYDPEKSYPTLVAFTPGSGPRSADWMIDELWPDIDEQEEWVLVTLVAAGDRGWFTHPSHHALEDLLRSLKKTYKVEGGRFHLFGFASGCRPALTYSNMSKKYFQTMTLVSSFAWSSYDDSDMSRWRDMPVLQIVGSESYTLEHDRAAHTALTKEGVRSTLQVIPENGLLVDSLRGDDLLTVIAEAHLGGEN